VYDDGAAQLPARLTHEERLVFQINELRMRWNNRIEWKEPLNNISQHLEEYFALPFPESFLAAKELCFIMKGLDEQQNPLYDSGLVNKLIAFLRKTAPELDRHLQTLPDEFVNERFNFTKDKAWLLQVLFDPSGKSPEQNDREYAIMLEKKLALLNDMIDIQQKAGNAVNAMDARLDIPDEVINQVFSPFTAGFFNRPQFYDYRQKCSICPKNKWIWFITNWRDSDATVQSWPSNSGLRIISCISTKSTKLTGYTTISRILASASIISRIGSRDIMTS
jgi:hypothetical protein